MAFIIKPFQRSEVFDRLGPDYVNRMMVDGCLTGEDREAGSLFVSNRQLRVTLRLSLANLIAAVVIGVAGIGVSATVGFAVANYQHALSQLPPAVVGEAKK